MSGSRQTGKHKPSLGSQIQYTPEVLDKPKFVAHVQDSVILSADPDYDMDEDEGHTHVVKVESPAEIPRGASLQTAWRIYQQCEAGWRSSTAYAELKKTLTSRVIRQNLCVTKCISFGLASPTTHPRCSVSMYQLAAFKSVIDILSTQRGQPPQAFAQDPVFNALDKQLLDRLHISMVDHPSAFHHINPTTFTFCPCATFSVTRGVLSRFPLIYLGNGPLEIYRDPKTGQRHSYLVTSYPEDNLDIWSLSAAQIEEKKRANKIKGAVIIESFQTGKKRVKLPDLRGHEDSGWVFQGMELYWKQQQQQPSQTPPPANPPVQPPQRIWR
jgi:SRR1